ncbi:hypothetical protein [Halorientalis halophila]|uniref:hypothetical protein n=1 Tax=Halorientalis halophila TaxID=3108499 RepID=UPI00300A2E22
MVTLSCDSFPRGVRRYLTTQLAQDDLEILALAIPNVERVTVNRPTDTPGSDDYYHRLPERYPDIDFGVCIEAEQLDHRLMDKYRNNMVVLVVESISEYTCISNLEVYFEEGKTQHREVTDGEANRCSYDDSLRDCIESLFSVEEAINPGD